MERQSSNQLNSNSKWEIMNRPGDSARGILERASNKEFGRWPLGLKRK